MALSGGEAINDQVHKEKEGFGQLPHDKDPWTPAGDSVAYEDSTKVTVGSERSPLLKKSDDNNTDSLLTPPIALSWSHFLIGPVIFIYFFAFMMSYYLIVEYTNETWLTKELKESGLTMDNLTSLGCETNSSDIVFQARTKAAEQASNWIVYFSLAQGVPAVLCNLILGAYTDRKGRKFLLAVGVLGTTIRLTISSVIIYQKLDLFYLIFACLVEGFTGQYATALQVALAYMSDITSTGKQRTIGMVVVELMLGVALTSSSLAVGYFIQIYGYLLPMILSAGLLVVNFVIMLLFLPETYGKEKRKARNNSNSVCDVFKASVAFFIYNDASNNRWKYIILFLAHALVNISYLARVPTETLYQMASPFCWSAEKVGIYAAIRTVVMMAVGLGSVKLLQAFLPDIVICILGIASYCAGFFWTAFVKTDLVFYLIIAVGCFGPLSTTMLRSILSQLTSPDKQGALFAAVAALEVVTLLLSSVGTSALYAATVSFMPGFVFLVLGGCNALGILLLIVLKIGWKVEEKRKRKDERNLS